MSQIHSVEAVLTVSDRGFSSALNNALKLLGDVGKAADNLKKVSDAVGKWTKEGTLLGAALDKLKGSLGMLINRLSDKSSVIKGVAGLKGGKLLIALGLIAAVIAVVVAAVVGLVAWWRTLGDRNSDLRDRFIESWNRVRTSFDEAATRIRDALGGLMGELRALWDAIAPVVDIVKYLIARFIELAGGAVSRVVASFFSNLINIISGVVRVITSLVNIVIGLFTGDLDRAREGLETLVEGIKKIFFSFFGVLLSGLSVLPGHIWEAIIGAVGKVKEWGTKIIEAGKEKITAFISGVIGILAPLPGKIWSTIIDTVGNIKEWGTKIIEAGKEKITAFISKVVGIMASLPGQIWGAIVGAVDRVRQWGSDLTARAREGVTNMRDIVVGIAGEIPARMLSIGRDIVNGVWQGIRDMRDRFTANIRDFFGGITSTVRGILGINSPSRVMRRLGGFTMEGFADGMKSQQKNVEGVAKDAADSVQDGFKDAMLTQKQLHSMLAKQQKAQMRKAAENAGNAIPEEFGRAVKMQQKFNEVSQKLLETKKKFAQSAAAFIQTGVQQAFKMQGKLQKMLAKQQKRQEAQVDSVAENAANSVQEGFRHAMVLQQKLYAMIQKLHLAKKEFARSVVALMEDGVSRALNMQKQLNTMLANQEVTHELKLAITPADAQQQSNLMERLIEAVESGKQIVMDSGELVGATYGHYDAVAGQTISYNARWGR